MTRLNVGSLAVTALVLLVPAGTVGAKGDPADVLAYANDARGNLDLYVTSVGLQAKPRRLVGSPKDELSPSWSPDGRRIAYRVNPTRSDVGDIWVVRSDGTRKTNLTRSPRVADWSPAWSPDGRLIAYFSSSGTGGDTWVMRPDGRDKHNVTRNGRLNEYPAWSPDNRSLAFNSHRDGQFEIYRSGVNGSGQRNLTRSPARDQWPAWSPDGTLIAFASDRDGNEDVFVMGADGSVMRNVTQTPQLDESHPAWMPDGRLSFSRHGQTGPIELWALDTRSGAALRLATDAQTVFTFGWRPRG